jgi:hypothetical protein
VREPEQLDIFIPLQRGERLREWANLAREHGADVGTAGGISAFADWLRSNGHTPAGVSDPAVRVLVAVMRDYEGVTSAPAVPAP